MHNRFFRIPLATDSTLLLHDLLLCEQHQWSEHFNKKDYAGSWTSIALRSATGAETDIFAHPGTTGYSDTPLLQQCPYFRQLLDSLPFQKEAVRLLCLHPGSHIATHTDAGLGYEYGQFRLHIPIVTDSGVLFRVDGEDLQMEAGECWYANFHLPHSVQHKGSNRRVHLVIDGLRNASADALFARAGYDFELERAQPRYDAATQARIREELALLNLPAADALPNNTGTPLR